MHSDRWLTDFEQRVWRQWRRAKVLVDLQIARDLQDDAGLSESDYDVLSTLSEWSAGRCRAGQLGQRLHWSTSRLTNHVGRMERRGLVERGPTDDDGRGVQISLTTTGWKTLRAAAPGHIRSVRRHFIDQLDPTELDALDALTKKILRHVDTDPAIGTALPSALDPGGRT